MTTELKTIAAQLDALRIMRDRYAIGSELRALFNAVCDRMDVLHSALAIPSWPHSAESKILVSKQAPSTIDLRKRIAELEKAIRDAEKWVNAGEGVGITYYHENYGDDDSVEIIESLISRMKGEI